MEAHGAAVDARSTGRASARRGPGSGSRARRSPRRGRCRTCASRSEASTSCVLLPMEETMPMPVTTTRLMALLLSRPLARRAPAACGRVSRQPRRRPGTARPAGPWPHRCVSPSAFEPAVGDAEHQLRRGSPASGRPRRSTFLTSGSTWPVNLTSPTPSARPRPWRAEPAEEEADHLPQRVEAEAARHHRIALEVAGEEPEVRA